ncbi:MAG: UDP-N-acetylglucosamine 2-epimerase (non-hydrolyzing) [Planctomycetota bacterium]
MTAVSDSPTAAPTASGRRRVLVAIGTRPEAIKLAPVVRALQDRDRLAVRVLATAQHRQMLDQVLRFFAIEPDLDLDLMQAGQTLSDLTARLLTAVDGVLADEQPDLVVGQGDTTTVLATALACFYRGVPFAHVEAGLRTGDLGAPFPEEMNRAVTGRLAHLHFPPTEGAAQNLRDEGVADAAIEVTGNPVIDALLWAAEHGDLSDEFAPPSGERLVLLTAHRRESFGAPLLEICAAVRELVRQRPVRVVYPVHPNPTVQATVHRELGDEPKVQLIEPLDYPRFVAAMRAAHLVWTDSGGVQEEAPALGKPVLVLRDTTERPEGVTAGTARLVGPSRERILAETLRLLDDDAAYRAVASAVNPYGDGHAAPRIAAAVERFLCGASAAAGETAWRGGAASR